MRTRRPLTHVVAMGENGVIGRDQRLPWTMPSDLRRFKTLTFGKPILMGRRTFLSIGRVLPGRVSVVIASDPAFSPPPEVRVARDLDHALNLADIAADQLDAQEIMVIGGRLVFAQTLPLASRVELTLVHLSPPGDVFIPPYDPHQWTERFRSAPRQESGDDAPATTLTLVRNTNTC